MQRLYSIVRKREAFEASSRGEDATTRSARGGGGARTESRSREGGVPPRPPRGSSTRRTCGTWTPSDAGTAGAREEVPTGGSARSRLALALRCTAVLSRDSCPALVLPRKTKTLGRRLISLLSSARPPPPHAQIQAMQKRSTSDGFNDIPENVAAVVFSHLVKNPRHRIRLAAVSKVWRDAEKSDL